MKQESASEAKRGNPWNTRGNMDSGVSSKLLRLSGVPYCSEKGFPRSMGDMVTVLKQQLGQGSTY